MIPDADTDAGWEGARIKADMLRSQILQGADFAELAKQHSRDATAKDGGDLGTLKRGELSQDVEGAILVLKVEEVSQPFKSALGYHVFRLESKESLDGDGMVRIRQQIQRHPLPTEVRHAPRGLDQGNPAASHHRGPVVKAVDKGRGRCDDVD